MGIKVVSAFDGIACGRVAFERAGFNVEKYVAYEIEDSAIKVAKTNYPDIEEKGDVFNAVYKKGEFDILIGGSPCTYWSIAKAGNNNSRETEPSGLGWELFKQYVRALKEINPKYFMYENNASMSEEIKNCITEQLGVNPIMIDSADFSAQHRKRYYWTNIDFNKSWKKSEILFCDIIDKNGIYKYRNFSKYKDTIKISCDGKNLKFDTSGKGYYSQANRCKKTDQKWNTLPASGNDKNDIWVNEFVSRHITPIEAERLQTLPDNYTSCLNSDVKRTSVCGNGWTVDVITHILSGIKDKSYFE